MNKDTSSKKKILVLGESGLVGSRFTELNKDFFEFLAPDLYELDILDPHKLESYIVKNNPEIIINLAAYTDVDGAEKEFGNKDGLIYRLNSLAPKNLAEICRKYEKFLIHFSTAYVFDGYKKDRPYKEDDKKNPLGWYAKTKHFADEFIENSGCNFSIIRIDMPYRAHYGLKRDLARFFLRELKQGHEVTAVKNQKITPVFVDDISEALKKIIEKKALGVFHIASTDITNPFDFATLIAKVFGLDKNLISEISFAKYHETRIAPRSQHSYMDVGKFISEFGDGILHTNEENVKNFKGQNPQ